MKQALMSTTVLSHGYEYDYLVFLGRFQCLHFGHIEIIVQALNKSKKLIMGIGSSNVGRGIRNLFTFTERKQMIEQCGNETITQAVKDGRIIFVPLDDMPYMEQQWIKHVTSSVDKAIDADCPVFNPDIRMDGSSNSLFNPEMARRLENGLNIGLIGCKKDGTSYYLSLFPQWSEKFVSVDPHGEYNSTALRTALFEHGTDVDFWEQSLNYTTDNVRAMLMAYTTHSFFDEVRKEYEWVKKFKKTWENAPYPPTFNTVDAVVIQSGHVLLIKRGGMPGIGKLALVGGYVEQDETLVQSMLRELREETKLDLTDTALRGCIKKTRTFDNPFRSSRGRVITQAFLLQLPDRTKFPKTKAGDDAAAVGWYPLASLKPQDLFEDHYHIIETLVNDI